MGVERNCEGLERKIWESSGNCASLERKIWELSEIVKAWSGKYGSRAEKCEFGAENMGVERNCEGLEREI